MRFVIMVYSDPATWVHPMFPHPYDSLAPEEWSAQPDEFGMLLKEIAESGELIESAALADPVTSRTIRFRDGAHTASDGPLADAKEHMTSFFLVDCETPERAAEIAGRFPDVGNLGVEIRPVMELSGLEM